MKTIILTVLATSTLALSAQAYELKEIKTSPVLKEIVADCNSALKHRNARKLGDKISCPVINTYQIPKNLHGAKAEEYIYSGLSYSQFDTTSEGASEHIRGSMLDELTGANPELRESEEEEYDYYINTVSELSDSIAEAGQAKLTLWKNDPWDHDDNEAAVMIFNRKTNVLVVIAHEPSQNQ